MVRVERNDEMFEETGDVGRRYKESLRKLTEKRDQVVRQTRSEAVEQKDRKRRRK